MSSFLSVLEFSLSITLPIFLILALGIILYQVRIINDNFVDVSSKLVFNVTLPTLLFLSISKTPLSSDTDFSLALYGCGVVTLTYILLEFAAIKLIPKKQDRGVAVQGAFRSNMGIIGLAYCVNAYGEGVFSVASIYLGSVTILYNIFSVITLNRSLSAEQNIWHTAKGIGKNPLIIAILSALLMSATGLTLPAPLHNAGSYFAQMTLPLALLCAGASLNFSSLQKEMSVALISSAGKLLFIPIITTFGGYLMGYKGMELGVLFLMSSAPSAAASYIMARAMGGNTALAANIIVITTVVSLLTTSIGVTLLRSFNLI